MTPTKTESFRRWYLDGEKCVFRAFLSKPFKPARETGSLLFVQHEYCDKFAFTNFCWCKNDTNIFATVDCRGNVYEFNLKNWTLNNKAQKLVSKLNTSHMEEITLLKYQKLNDSYLLVSHSQDRTIIWSTSPERYIPLQTLEYNNMQYCLVANISYINIPWIITCLNDGAIFWNFSSLDGGHWYRELVLKYRNDGEALRKYLGESFTNMKLCCADLLQFAHEHDNNNETAERYHDRYYFATAGKGGPYIYVWTFSVLWSECYNITEPVLWKVIELPSAFKKICQIHFIRPSKKLLVLGSKGTVLCTAIDTLDVLFTIERSQKKITRFELCEENKMTTKKLLCIMNDGSLELLSLSYLLSKHSKTTEPLVVSDTVSPKVDASSQQLIQSLLSTFGGSTVQNTECTHSMNDSVPSHTIGEFKNNNSWPQSTRQKLKTNLVIFAAFAKFSGFFLHCLSMNKKIADFLENFEALHRRGIHGKWKSVKIDKYNRNENKMKLQLSLLSHWSNVLAEVKDLPKFVAPFVVHLKEMSNRQYAFEVLMSILHAFGTFWFETWPEPSPTLIGKWKNILKHVDDQLFQYCCKHQVNNELSAFYLLKLF
ncbi:hypothetical protein RFI_36934 [Reticulomyxa filosa]|uniref:Uncharacterized protein n=1 Tax=Reticulomyxa filosa TaxID=46433 RepID=X6LG15_RETFI|nr:hypothetical protein RFI_36934 [Reticulomyxa filosa]|eukprot:ETO00509.1 hypothetical protein RFI_36934 [Reticulomyxa filosa]